MMAKIEWYEEILALEPGSKVFFPFAKRLAEDGLHDKALAVLRHGLVQHPEYLEARVFLTHLLFAVGDTQTAMTESQQVFARLAPYPAFWEALSLANEAMPGDMSLLLRFMAESLRNPGLSLATAMRRGLSAPEPVAQPVEPATLTEPPVAHEPVAEAADLAEAAVVEEPEATAENADAGLADPLDPVVDELCETDEVSSCESDEVSPCETDELVSSEETNDSATLGEDEPLLPLFGEEPAPPSSVGKDLATEVPAVETFPENAEAMLACAASVDEALAELDDDLESNTEDNQESAEPPLLSAEDLDELDKTLFSEAPVVAPVDEASEQIEGISEVEHAEELAELDLPVAQPEDLEVNPFLAAAADADDTVPPMEPPYELNELAEEPAEPEASGDTAEILEVAEIEEVEEVEEIAKTHETAEPQETPEIAEASESVEAPALYLDGGLLDLAQEEDPAQTVPPSTHVDIQSQTFTHKTPNLHVEIQPAQDENDDPDMPDDGPVRTRSMAEVLAEQGDIDGALTIYDELLHKAAPDESAFLTERMDTLRSQKTAEKTEQKPAARSDKAGLRSMLENLAGRLEKRAKA